MNTRVKQTRATKRLIDNLKFLKFSNGLTTDDFAKAISVHRQSIGAWFEGRALPTTEQLKKISDAYEISINDLVRIDIVDAPDNFLSLNYNIAQFNLNLN